MTLIIDNREQLRGQPGLHAFIVGASHYAHLPDFDEPANAEIGFGLQRLASPAFSAYSLYKRLEQLPSGNGHARLAVPLKTCRLLLAPSALEQSNAEFAADLPGLAVLSPEFRPFARSALAWRNDASDHKDSITLFYFGGHGVRTHTEDAVLAMADFNEPELSIMLNCVKVTSLHLGMAPTKKRPNMARTQFYFIDACRNMPEQMLEFRPAEVPPLWDIELNDEVDDRRWPIYFSAAPNQLAHGRRGTTSFFCASLLRGLECAAEDPEDDPDNLTRERWPITPDTLGSGIERHLKRLLNIGDADYFVDIKGARGKSALVYLSNPPEVDIDIAVVPAELVGHAHVALIDGSHPLGAMTPKVDKALERAQMTIEKIPAGPYYMRLRSTRIGGDYVSRNKFINQKIVKPWVHRVQLMG